MDDDNKQTEHNGFYCEVCDCIVKDSLNYLDHTNGKRHNRNLGISLKKFTDSTLEEVQEMLNLKKREREDKELSNSLRYEHSGNDNNQEEDFEAEEGYEEEDEDEDERRRRLRREKKKRQKARRAEM